MHRVTLIPMVRQTLFGPRVTIILKDGRRFTKQASGREFIWDFETHAQRMREIVPALRITPQAFDRLVDTCRTLDTVPNAAATLIGLTIP